jgi:probable HAF family extracellular repeat protein
MPPQLSEFGVSVFPNLGANNKGIREETVKKNLSAYLTAMTLIAALAVTVKVAAQQYTVTDLGPGADWLGGVNNKGNVDGTAILHDGSQRAFLWRRGAETVLGTFGGPNSVAFKGPTEKGQVVGKAETSTPDPFGEDFCLFSTNLICLPFVWQNGVMMPLPTLGGNNGIAFDLNNRGQVAGSAENTTQDPTCPAPSLEAKPVIWEKDEIQELPTFTGDPLGAALSINDDGQAVGGSFDCSVSVSHALLWHHGTVTNLGNLGGVTNNIAQNINNQGQVVGFSDLPGDTNFHAFLWTDSNGLRDLGTLPGDVFSFANGNNDRGQVVGGSCDIDFDCRAVLWQNGALADLNTLIPAGFPLFLVEAFDINSRGEIVGLAETGTGETHAFLATPSSGASSTESTTLAAPGQISEHPKVTLPENVRKMLRQRRGLGRSQWASPQTSLSTTAAISAPNEALTPTSLSFGTVAIGTISAAKTVTLKNIGTASLTISSIAITGTNAANFAQTHTCGTSLAVGASCTISVTFNPTASGTRTAALSVSDNAAGSPQKMSLSGIGTTAKLSPTSLNFGTVAIGATSSAKTITLTNVGTATFTISGIAITGANPADFAQTHTCGSSLGAGASCSITVTFKPTASGMRTAAVSVSDSAAGSPQKVSLSGIGTTAKLSPTSLNFGSLVIGTTSPPNTVTLTNIGTTTLSITGIAITGTNAGDFAQTHTCGSALAVSASCSISITFTPTASGTHAAAVSVTDNAAGSPQKVALSGIGASPNSTLGRCLVSAQGFLTGGCLVPVPGLPFGRCGAPNRPVLCPPGQKAISPFSRSCTNLGKREVDDSRPCS